MNVIGTKAELVGKTIEWAGVIERANGDAEFLLRFTDGSSAGIAAWKRDGYALQMNVDLTPNANPATDSGASSRRGI